MASFIYCYTWEIHGLDYIDRTAHSGENKPINQPPMLMWLGAPFHCRGAHHYMNGMQHDVLTQGAADKHTPPQLLGIMNKTAMNIHVQAIWWIYAIICLKYIKE